MVTWISMLLLVACGPSPHDEGAIKRDLAGHTVWYKGGSEAMQYGWEVANELEVAELTVSTRQLNKEAGTEDVAAHLALSAKDSRVAGDVVLHYKLGSEDWVLAEVTRASDADFGMIEEHDGFKRHVRLPAPRSSESVCADLAGAKVAIWGDSVRGVRKWVIGEGPPTDRVPAGPCTAFTLDKRLTNEEAPTDEVFGTISLEGGFNPAGVMGRDKVLRVSGPVKITYRVYDQGWKVDSVEKFGGDFACAREEDGRPGTLGRSAFKRTHYFHLVCE